jgi:hypothetical protein
MMTDLLLPFQCPICGSDGFTQVLVKGREGTTRATQAYECSGCSVMFRERERFTTRRLKVMGADGIDLKPLLDKNRQKDK